MKNRIKQIRKRLNLTQEEFGEKIGSARNTIANYEIGKRNPSNAVIVLICKQFNINEEWLRTGIGEMLKGSESKGYSKLHTNERFKLLRRTLNLTQQEFANRIGMKRNTIANYETGRNEPSTSVISLICREFGVNKVWLHTGEGNIFAENVTLTSYDKKSMIIGVIDIMSDKQLDSLWKYIVKNYKNRGDDVE